MVRDNKPELQFLPIAAGLLVVCGILLPESIGLLRTDYDSIGHYLSELGAHSAEYSAIINYLGFLPVAITCLIIVVTLRKRISGYRIARVGVLLFGAGIFIGYLGAFSFPCDFGCPAQGTTRQGLHNLAGVMEYVFAFTGLVLMCIGVREPASRTARILSFATAIVVVLGFTMMLDPAQAEVRGLWQRSADYSMFALLCFLSIKYRGYSTGGGTRT